MEGTSSNKQTERTIYFDYLRVFATFAVMILHIAAQNWRVTDVNGLEWQVFNFFDSISRWGVPVFVMISGALFLSRDIPLKKIYRKYILRMITAFLIWSVIYALCKEGNLTNKLAVLVQGKYHMWFILMIIGIYMCLPLIKPLVETDARIRYYLVLTLVFGFVIPEVITLVNDFGSATMIKGIGGINDVVQDMNMHVVLGYVSYFVLGYYMNKINLQPRQRKIIYALGILGFAFTVGMDSLVALKTQTYCGNYYGNFTVNVLFEALAVFTWFKYHPFTRLRLHSLMRTLSTYSFGAYLVHVLVIEQLNNLFGLNTLSFHPVLAVIGIGILVCILSFAISALLHHIPIVKKYMV